VESGATSVLAWVAQDDIGGAVVLFTVVSMTIALIFAIVHVACDVLSADPGKPPEPSRPLLAARTNTMRASLWNDVLAQVRHR
jgi:hypothetical protein